MKRKKLMATAVASALAAAQMVMPVAAATGGGSVDVNVQNTDTVLRVQVPTDLVVAVDEYEIAKDGSQISSAAFEMVNKSAVPVSVAVTSTATLGSGITLAATNEVDNTADEIWLLLPRPKRESMAWRRSAISHPRVRTLRHLTLQTVRQHRHFILLRPAEMWFITL